MASIHPVIIIPTYNNADTIKNVISEVRDHMSSIIVINDGSTDSTGEILQSISGIDLIQFDVNRGKGAALRAGLKMAQEKGFTHAITVDADGQHLACDIPLFIEKIKEEPETLWIGDRIIPVEGGLAQPPRSRFGRKFGAFWYKWYTGTYIRDTQSGFRAYPLSYINELGCDGDRYEFEIELLITTAWKGKPVKSIPIHLLYQRPEERVSHFRPFRDFMRISKVNSRAAITRIFFPSNLMDVQGFGLRDKIKFLIQKELRANATPVKAALSLALGVFMAITPIHGFQVVTLLALTFLLRLNRPLAILGVSVSSAPLLPVWIAAGLGIGKLIVPLPVATVIVNFCEQALPQKVLSWMQSSSSVNGFLFGFVQWFIGSFVLAIIGGFVTFLVAFPLFSSIAKNKLTEKKVPSYEGNTVSSEQPLDN